MSNGNWNPMQRGQKVPIDKTFVHGAHGAFKPLPLDTLRDPSLVLGHPHAMAEGMQSACFVETGVFRGGKAPMRHFVGSSSVQVQTCVSMQPWA